MTATDGTGGSGTVRHGGARIAYDVSGAGDPVVLLHAAIADRRMWGPQLEALSSRHRVVRVDLRGFGETVADGSPFAHHADVRAVLDALGIEAAALVGASTGGAVALDLARHHPDRVSALVVIGAVVAGHRFQDRELREGRRRVEELLAAGEPDAAADLEISLWVAGPERLAAELDDDLRSRVREMLLTSYRREVGDERPPGRSGVVGLAHVRVPTLVLVGSLDRPDVHAIAGLLADRLPRARRVRLAGTAHLPSLEVPERVARLVLEFLDEKRRAPSRSARAPVPGRAGTPVTIARDRGRSRRRTGDSDPPVVDAGQRWTPRPRSW